MGIIIINLFTLKWGEGIIIFCIEFLKQPEEELT